MENKSLWESNLGFEPEKNFEPKSVEGKCYKCGSYNYNNLPSIAWSNLRKCNVCEYYTYIIYNDRMGGLSYDNVAIDKRYSERSIWRV